jgi:tRNA-splicing ligase RtcB
MRVPVRVYGSEELVGAMDDHVFAQAANVATLPGIVDASLVMPDAHWGYGFPIGGVAAMDPEDGVISPGGIGFDINCGMRLARTDLTWPEVEPRLPALMDALAARVPAGTGVRGFLDVADGDFQELLVDGARWAVARGYGDPEDLARTESGGRYEDADPASVSERAVERGRRQVGTLGSGNHYLEVQVARREAIDDPRTARAFGLDRDEQVVVMFHCGSRGFGHQVASDYLHDFLRKMPTKFGLPVIERDLACAPLRSEEGQAYLGAMRCAANMSLANRQVILHRVREVFEEVFGRSAGIRTVYDVAHNHARFEQVATAGGPRTLLVHRKGATRALPPGHPELPPEYRETGQPVLLGGSMETGSYLLAGMASGAESFYSTAHGSGRTLSRTQARKRIQGRALQQRMAERGILVRAASWAGLAEEAGFAYKDVEAVAEATEVAGLSRRVAHLVPVGNVKG